MLLQNVYLAMDLGPINQSSDPVKPLAGFVLHAKVLIGYRAVHQGY